MRRFVTPGELNVMLRESCETMNMKEYAELIRPLNLNKNEVKELLGGFRSDEKFLNAECERLCYDCKYDIYNNMDPQRAILTGGAAYRVKPTTDEKEAEYYVALDNGKEITCRGTPDTKLKDEDGDLCATGTKDPISQTCIDPTDLVTLSDGKCYSRKSMNEYILHKNTTKGKDKTSKTQTLKLPLTQKTMVLEDFQMLKTAPTPFHPEECPEFNAEKDCVEDILDVDKKCIDVNELVGVKDEKGSDNSLSDGHCYRKASIETEIKSGRMNSPVTGLPFTERDIEIIKNPLQTNELNALKQIVKKLKTGLAEKWMEFIDEKMSESKASVRDGAKFDVAYAVKVSGKCPRIEGSKDRLDGTVTSVHVRDKQVVYTIRFGQEVIRGIKEKYVTMDSYARRLGEWGTAAALKNMPTIEKQSNMGKIFSAAKSLASSAYSTGAAAMKYAGDLMAKLGSKIVELLVWLGKFILQSPRTAVFMLYLAKGFMKKACQAIVLRISKWWSGGTKSGLNYEERPAKVGDIIGMGDTFEKMGELTKLATPGAVSDAITKEDGVFAHTWKKGSTWVIGNVEKIPYVGSVLGPVCDSFMGGAKEVLQYQAELMAYQNDVENASRLFKDTLAEIFAITQGCSPVEVRRCNEIESMESCDNMNGKTLSCRWDAEKNVCNDGDPGDRSATATQLNKTLEAARLAETCTNDECVESKEVNRKANTLKLNPVDVEQHLNNIRKKLKEFDSVKDEKEKLIIQKELHTLMRDWNTENKLKNEEINRYCSPSKKKCPDLCSKDERETCIVPQSEEEKKRIQELKKQKEEEYDALINGSFDYGDREKILEALAKAPQKIKTKKRFRTNNIGLFWKNDRSHGGYLRPIGSRSSFVDSLSKMVDEKMKNIKQSEKNMPKKYYKAKEEAIRQTIYMDQFLKEYIKSLEYAYEKYDEEKATDDERAKGWGTKGEDHKEWGKDAMKKRDTEIDKVLKILDEEKQRLIQKLKAWKKPTI